MLRYSQPAGTANTALSRKQEVNMPEALSLPSSLRPWPPPSSGDAAAPSVPSPASALPATPRSLKQLRSRFEINANQSLTLEADRVSQRAHLLVHQAGISFINFQSKCRRGHAHQHLSHRLLLLPQLLPLRNKAALLHRRLESCWDGQMTIAKQFSAATLQPMALRRK